MYIYSHYIYGLQLPLIALAGPHAKFVPLLLSGELVTHTFLFSFAISSARIFILFPRYLAYTLVQFKF